MKKMIMVPFTMEDVRKWRAYRKAIELALEGDYQKRGDTDQGTKNRCKKYDPFGNELPDETSGHSFTFSFSGNRNTSWMNLYQSIRLEKIKHAIVMGRCWKFVKHVYSNVIAITKTCKSFIVNLIHDILCPQKKT